MSLFKISGKKVKKIISKKLDLEKNLQLLFEENLEEILNIIFIAHEYSTSFGGRIDTLGIDKDGSPCVIEYKKTQNDNVINQGLSYLRWLLDHKADFEILSKNKKIDIEIDWDSPRVICIAESYSKFDIDTADILPIKIELFRYNVYEDNILYLEPESYQKVKISTSGIIKNGMAQKSKEKYFELQKAYSIDDHLDGIDKELIELFQEIRERILSLDKSITEEPKKHYIAYKISSNFVDIAILKNSLKIYLNLESGKLNDPKNLARNLRRPTGKIGAAGNGDYEIKIENNDEIDAIFDLIKQSYNFNK